MAERERLTKRERRERAREERRRKEEEARKRARRQQMTTAAAGVLVVLAVAWVVVNALGGGPEAVAIELAQADVDAARSAAGCEVVDERLEFDRDHYEPASAPPADALYGDQVRPTHGGPHFFQTAGLVTDGSSSQLDERATTHNLEHGAVIVWYDPEQVEGDTIAEMEDWSERLNDAGFGNTRSGGGIFVSPYTEPGIASGKAVALRAWGIAVDCSRWDEDAAHGFVIDRYGTHGAAPERTLSPYPDGVLDYADAEVSDNTEAPADGDAPSDMVGTGTPTVDDTGPATGSATEGSDPDPSPTSS